jgi:hypothetical protein
MKEPVKDAAVPPPKPLHANAYPKDGFSLVVDGRFKQHFATMDEAKRVAAGLKAKFPSLQIAVRDAVTAERFPVELTETAEQAG